MHMIGHQDISMKPAPMFQTCLMQPPQIGSIVVIRKENRLPAIATLDDMRRHTRQVESWLSRHRQSLSWTVYTLAAMQASVCQIRYELLSEKGY
jgi:hypothetical protein